MDYKEKYEHALARAKEILECSPNPDARDVKMVLSFFPELKESEDERIIAHIKKAVEYYWSDEPLEEILAWLEKQKPAWSEGDESYLNTTIAYLKDAKEFKKTAENCVNWLKSLKDRYAWKPSELDILLLERIANGKSNPQDFQASLCGLIGQLKRLRED